MVSLMIIIIIIYYILYTCISYLLQAYVASKLGVEWIGYAMLCFGASNTIGSLLVGILGKYTGRIPMFLASFILNLGTIAFLQFWSWQGDVMFSVFFIVPAVWGICDAIWHTQSDGQYNCFVIEYL